MALRMTDAVTNPVCAGDPTSENSTVVNLSHSICNCRRYESDNDSLVILLCRCVIVWRWEEGALAVTRNGRSAALPSPPPPVTP